MKACSGIKNFSLLFVKSKNYVVLGSAELSEGRGGIALVLRDLPSCPTSIFCQFIDENRNIQFIISALTSQISSFLRFDFRSIVDRCYIRKNSLLQPFLNLPAYEPVHIAVICYCNKTAGFSYVV